MSIQPDVTEARRAADALVAAVERLRSSHPESLDLRRLVEDVARVRVDLDLLAGEVPVGATPAGRAPSAVRSADRDPGYDPREFVDGSYEGTTPRRR